MNLKDLIGEALDAASRKRGSGAKLLQHMKRISALPKQRQRAVMDVIEAMLAQQGRQQAATE